MNSKFTLSSLGEFCPVDWGKPAVLETTPPNVTASTRNKSNKDASTFKVFVEPQILGRRVEPQSRLIYPSVERLPVESHVIDMTVEAVNASRRSTAGQRYDSKCTLQGVPRSTDYLGHPLTVQGVPRLMDNSSILRHPVYAKASIVQPSTGCLNV